MTVKRTSVMIGKFKVEHEQADRPGRFVDKTAMELWTVLRKAGAISLPGFGTNMAWEVVTTSYVSEADALQKARKVK